MAHRLIVILLAFSITPAAVQAQEEEPEPEVVVGGVWREEDDLIFAVETSNLLDDEARRTIDEGGTTALDYTFELYRVRRGWFDAFITGKTFEFRVTYDTFEQEYRVFSPDTQLKTDNFQQVKEYCTELGRVSMGTFDDLRLDTEGTYYIVVRVRYQPMTVETIDDLSDWVRGGRENRESTENRRGGVGSRLARVLMSAAGFGEQDLQGESDHFQPVDLQPPPG